MWSEYCVPSLIIAYCAMSAESLALFRVGEPNLGFQDEAYPSWFPTTFLIVVVEVMTSGLPPVCKLWLGVSKGMLPVRRLAPKIVKVMAVYYCGCQLARRLEWAAPAYH